MFPHQNKLLAICAALTLSACATQQNPAPVVSGTDVYTPTLDQTIMTTPSVDNNPYNTTPYDPNATTATPTVPTTQVQTPSVETSASAPIANTNSNSRSVAASRQPYVGNYSPVDKSASVHTVQAGDTVFNIAKRYGIKQENLRTWNNIGADNAIHLGQTLRVKPVGSTSNTAAVKPKPATQTAQTTQTTKPSTTSGNAQTTPVLSSNSQTVSGILWQVPTAGKIVRHFGGTNKGIEISGSRGQPVMAAANGQVVYSGSGLRGYGNLIIVQHTTAYLTAYGHNETLLVKEGQLVKRGQQIATMGSSDSSSGVKLHFELRENGTPVDPTRFVKF